MTLHVERLGCGPDLVLLHGWGLHGGAWREVASRLAARFQVHVIDLPGHGRSDADAFDGLDSLADRVAPAVPNGSAVCGWSLGALVALRLAARAPATVRALGLVAATPSFITREGWTAGLAPGVLADFARDLARDRLATVRAFLHLNARGAAGVRDHVRALEALQAGRPSADGSSLAAGLGVLATTDLRASCATLAQPAIVIHGTRDALVPPQAGRFLAETMPNATLVEIDDAPHAVLMTNAQAVASALEPLHG